MSYKQLLGISGECTTAVGSITIGPLAIEHFDYFSIMYQNDNSLITVISAAVQVAITDSGLGNASSDDSPEWVAMNTATIPQPATIGASAAVVTSAIKNSWRWARVLLNTCQTAAAGKLKVLIGGHTR